MTMFVVNGPVAPESASMDEAAKTNREQGAAAGDATLAANAVLRHSVPMPSSATKIQGIDFNNYKDSPITVQQLASHLYQTGFQASNIGRAIEIINQMRRWKPGDFPPDEDEENRAEPPPDAKCTIFLGYTSNLISSGLRETFRYLVEHRQVDCVVTTAGGIEEDLIKCIGPTYLGSFNTPGKILREGALNRIGNLLVPNDNYCGFEDWLTPILDKMLDEQDAGTRWTPSKLINRLGKEINDESSVLYWAWKNDIPVFCPALTDGSLGDMIYFHTLKNSLSADISRSISLDIVQDLVSINTIALRAYCTGMIIVGGGVIKHHICNANLMRNGANYAVYINTSEEFDGSDAGASPDEAISWGKIKVQAKSVKVQV